LSSSFIRGRIGKFYQRFACASSIYLFRINSAAITSEGKERTIRINDLVLQLEFTLKGNSQNRQAAISTSIDVREGQKVVVGKANIDNADNALILVLAAKVVE
jgi:hypothetical protein